MRTCAQILADYLKLSGDSSSANSALGLSTINATDRLVLAMRPFPWKETTSNITTTASGATYEMPVSAKRLVMVRKYNATNPAATLVEDSQFWEHLQSLNAGTSDIPQYAMQEGDRFSIWPAYGTAGQLLTIRYTIGRADMTKTTDYATGTVTFTNASAAVVGAGTTWTTNAKAGDWILASGGDNNWYKIASVTDNTHLTLQKVYEGTTVAGSAYSIGNVSLIPADYHDLLLWRPLAIFFEQHEKPIQAARYWKLYDGGKEAGILNPQQPPGGLLGTMLEEEDRRTPGPYVNPRGDMTIRNINFPPKDITI